VQTSRALSSSATLSSLSSCAIEGVAGYYFYNNPGNLQAAFQQNSGTWGAIHPGDSDTATYTDNYLKLYFNHGRNPANATYAYAILPTMAPSAVAGYGRNPQSTIVANTTSIQAVKNSVLGTVAANFWGSSGGTADIITANRACSVITYETAGRMSVGVSDPSQSLTGPNGTITVTLNRAATGTIVVDDEVKVKVLSTAPTIQIEVNVAGLHGATLHASFSIDPVPVINSNANMVGISGKPLSFQVAANNSPTLYGATGLPTGLSINTASGVISGTSTENGTFMVTLSAANSAGTGYANLTITVAASASNISATYGSTTTWVCPANVTAVQVEAWGAGGAGGSAQRVGASGTVQYGGGGAGGTYAKVTSYPVVPGSTYYINVGTCASNTSSVAGTAIAGGDSWFSSSNSSSGLILAKGGAGGTNAIGNSSTTAYATGGTGSTSGSIGNVLYAGGNGANGVSGFAGGGGSGAGYATNGVSATNNVGAAAPAGGGNGGTGPTTGSLSGTDGFTPGGGGAGSRNSSGTVTAGASGGTGQIILTVLSVAKADQTITFGLDSATATVGDLPRTLIATSSSGLLVALTSLDPNVATFDGNTLKIVGVGTATLTATQTGDGNYEAAVPVSVSLTVSAAPGTTFASWNGGSATMTSALLLKYALGGASSSTGVSEATTSLLGSSTFTMTAVVRTDDLKLSIIPKATTSLSATWDYLVTTTGKNDGVTQAGVGTGCERKVFTVSRASNSKIFMKIDVSYTP